MGTPQKPAAPAAQRTTVAAVVQQSKNEVEAQTPTATEEAEEADEPELVSGTVARGRTVIDNEGRKGPGDTVNLPRDEVASLTRLGFLEDPNAEPPKEANGPTFGRS